MNRKPDNYKTHPIIAVEKTEYPNPRNRSKVTRLKNIIVKINIVIIVKNRVTNNLFIKYNP